MTWQIAAFTILGVALVAGFGWYERSKPDARIVALVATLAAFAALGRIAFAALPNVKPTTDIVLISGYALGGAPGFAVGAIAGLTSNFFFGQGPWTPWQMAAWAMTGIIGAGLAVVTARRIGRWPLAIVCAVVGFAFAAMQDVGDWVTYSDHSLAQLGVYVGKGLGFDAIHAAGCFAFALAFGPPLTRSIQRFARRLQVSWRPAGATVVPAALCAVMLLTGASGSLATDAHGATGPAGYLLAAQHRDGGLGSSPGAPSSTLYSGWAALGLAAAGHNPQDVSHGGGTLLGYIRAGGISDVGSLERTILVAHTAGVSPRRFGGRDLVARLEARIRPDGSVSEQVNLTSFAILALRAAGVRPSLRSYDWLMAQQDGDGGFNFATRGGASDVDDTGAALQALASGPAGAATHRRRAVTFLVDHQNRDGGFAADVGGESNAQSTAWAVQGLLAAGVNPDSLDRRHAVSPLRYLGSLISPDGHVRYSRTTDQTPVWVTAQAIMALARKPLPLASVPRAHHAPRPRAASVSGGSGGSPVAPRASAPGAHADSKSSPHRRSAHSVGPGATVPSTLAADAAVLVAVALAPVGAG